MSSEVPITSQDHTPAPGASVLPLATPSENPVPAAAAASSADKGKGKAKANEGDAKGKGKAKGKDGDEKSKGAKRALLKTPKGTTDYSPEEMAIREKVFQTVIRCFKKHGAVTIETPVFELKEILTGKYGEDSKLIYDLADQGGEECALRYDLTVPFARYVAANRVLSIKRYHIARVYRRDNPVMTKGRFREFYQCDFDVAGEYDLMLPDSECIKMMVEILDELQVGDYRIKLNHRKLLDGLFAIVGVPEDKFRAISSAVDKLDKSPWDEVRTEMVEVKGLDPAVADRIKTFVDIKGKPMETLAYLKKQGTCTGNADATRALDELEVLFRYLECLGALHRVELDLSLARGLDYYTGIIYEAVIVSGIERLGSIAAGGRYDKLVGMYGNKDIPAVGFSVGIERVFAILYEEAKKKGAIRENDSEVFVTTVDKGLVLDRLKLVGELWAAGIKAEHLYKENPRIDAQLKYADNFKIPLAIIVGKRELEEGTVTLKNLSAGESDPNKQVSVKRADLVDTIIAKLKEMGLRK
eukprot:TRINITY_DN548_c0_g1_i2.p1 TRINITY_DN548_c0_g1~~TRINITY_DN548_c0_g1_i2.p1  ORF type:complete len:535 (-),score=182.91 TRINITY_DN548_c0_g1_i2:56-1636(-)